MHLRSGSGNESQIIIRIEVCLRSGSDLLTQRIPTWEIWTRRDLNLTRIFGSDPEPLRRPNMNFVVEFISEADTHQNWPNLSLGTGSRMRVGFHLCSRGFPIIVLTHSLQSNQNTFPSSWIRLRGKEKVSNILIQISLKEQLDLMAQIQFFWSSRQLNSEFPPGPEAYVLDPRSMEQFLSQEIEQKTTLAYNPTKCTVL